MMLLGNEKHIIQNGRANEPVASQAVVQIEGLLMMCKHCILKDRLFMCGISDKI